VDDDIAALLRTLQEGDARRLLGGLGQRAALREFERDCAIRYALALFHQRVDRLMIRDRLMQRYELGIRTAYRYIDEALIHFCQPEPRRDKAAVDDKGFDNRKEPTT
jgi:hypothetical protein